MRKVKYKKADEESKAKFPDMTGDSNSNQPEKKPAPQARESQTDDSKYKSKFFRSGAYRRADGISNTNQLRKENLLSSSGIYMDGLRSVAPQDSAMSNQQSEFERLLTAVRNFGKIIQLIRLLWHI